MVAGLTTDGLRAKIRDNKFELSQDEAIDLFFIYPGLADIKWENNNVKSVRVDGLNLEFSVGN